MPQLVIQDPDGGRQVYVLDGPETILGRDPNVDIPLADRTVSRRHARVFVRDHAYWVEDLGSGNGVIIEGKPIDAAHQLRAGVSVTLGGLRLSLQATAEEKAGPAFSLLGLSEAFASQRFMLPVGELSVGRADGCAVVIPDASVSRQHAILTVTANTVAVEDQGSSNGTWVNGGRIERATLHPGDRVRFGSVLLELEIAGRTYAFAVAARGWNRFRRAHRTLQAAVVIGLFSALLLLVTIVVAAGRSGFGSGPSDEELYLATIAADLTAARTAAAAGAWESAADAYQRALDRDPTLREARRGLMDAQHNRVDQNILTKAQTQLDAGDAEQALATLRRIADDSHYAGAAAEVASRAGAAIALRAAGEARTACQRSEWSECHRLAVFLLENDPQSQPGQALIAEAETAMSARRIPFSPWVEPSPGPPQDRRSNRTALP